MKIENFGAQSPPSRYVHLKGPLEPTPLHALSFGAQDPEKNKWLIEFGAVYVNSKRVILPEYMVSENDVIRVHLDPKRYSLDKKSIQRRIVHKNEDFIVVNKPSGLPMHPTLDNFHENLAHGFDFPVYVTHRLDVPTSGLVVLAKTKEYQALFNKLIFNRQIRKVYQAFVDKPMREGRLRHFMVVTVKAPKEVLKEVPLEKENEYDECLLDILNCKKLENSIASFELRIELLTGRTHQIRAQLACEGNPIIGDEMYGGRTHSAFGLHASELHFKCPKSDENFTFLSPAQF